MTLAKYYVNCRHRAGLSQMDIARHFKFTTAQFISNVERGIVPIPMNRLKSWLKLIKADPTTVYMLMKDEFDLVTKRALGLK